MGKHLPEMHGRNCLEPGAVLTPVAGGGTVGYALVSQLQREDRLEI